MTATFTSGYSREALVRERAQQMGRNPDELVARMQALPQDLVRAYFETSYSVHVQAGECVLRIPEPVPAAINELLEARQAASWTIITAVNPYSQPVSAEENTRRSELLAELLTLHRLQTFPATGKSDCGGGEEESLCVLGLTYNMAQALGSAFQQNAVLYGEKDAVVELIFCAQRPASRVSR